MIFGISARVMTLAATLVLTRFIAPEQYGAVMSASIAVLSAGVFTSFAFGQYLISHRAPPSSAFQAAVLHFGLGVIAMAVLYLFRHAIGDMLDTPEMVPFIGAYAAAHLIDRARYVPDRLLIRDLQFRVVARINAAGEVFFVVTALSLAGRWGANAIIAGVLGRSVITAILYFYEAPRSGWLVYSRFDTGVVRAMFGYGLPIMIAASADRAALRWDNLIISKLFGPAIMAQYGLAFSLAEMPVNNIAANIGDVLMPSYTRLDERHRQTAVIRSAALMALILWPLGTGLASVASTLVPVFFDERWQMIAPMLAILGVMSVFLPLGWPAVAYLQAIQRPHAVMVISFTRAILVLPLVAVFGAIGGPELACVGGATGYALHTIGTVIGTGWATGLPVGPHLAATLQPAIAAVPMFIACRVLEHWLAAAGVLPILSLAIQVLAGAVVYAACVLLFLRPTAREFLRLARGFVGGRRAAVSLPPTGEASSPPAAPPPPAAP